MITQLSAAATASRRILLLSGYDAGSHRRWREGLAAHFPDFAFDVLTLPARHFSWRVRGNALYWALSETERLDASHDLLLATSMVDLATLRGLVPALAALPSVLYFHENQFAYPPGETQSTPVEAQITSVYSALAADRLLFNSAYNRDTFIAGATGLLRRLPDYVPAGVGHRLAAKAAVLPVALEDDCYTAPRERDPQRPLQMVWNHRREYDKGPGRLLALVDRLLESGMPLQLHVVGHEFRKAPAEFDTVYRRLEAAGALGYWGYIDSREDYRALLAEADIVLSTALHEFQGLAVQEAMAAGCLPVVPDRLAYREYVPQTLRYASVPEDVDSEAAAAAALIAQLWRTDAAGWRHLRRSLAIDRFGWPALAERWRKVLTKPMSH